MTTNFGDFQNEVYAEAVKGVTTRYPFDFASIERKASEALPDWVYRYVSAAAGDGRTQRANIAAFSCYGIVPRMMVSPPKREANSAVSTLQLLPGVVKAAGATPVMFDSGVRSATDAIIALALGATAVGLGRPYAYALSYGGAESLTHYLRSLLAELDLCLAVCGFKNIATLKEAGVEEVINSRELPPG